VKLITNKIMRTSSAMEVLSLWSIPNLDNGYYSGGSVCRYDQNSLSISFFFYFFNQMVKFSTTCHWTKKPQRSTYLELVLNIVLEDYLFPHFSIIIVPSLLYCVEEKHFKTMPPLLHKTEIPKPSPF